MMKRHIYLMILLLITSQTSCGSKKDSQPSTPFPTRELSEAFTPFVSKPGCSLVHESPTIERVEEALRNKFSDREFLTFKFIEGKVEILDHFITCSGKAIVSCRTSVTNSVTLDYIQTRDGAMIMAKDGLPHAFVAENKNQNALSVIGISAEFRKVVEAFGGKEVNLKIGVCQ